MINFDATFFAFLALVLFIALVFYAKAPGKVTDLLDGRRNRIAKELDDAKRLRQEAEALLNEYKQKRTDAVKEAAAIIDQARREAQAYAEETRVKLGETLARRTKQAEQKIAQAQAAAAKDVRASAAEAAIAAATQLLADQASGAAKAKLVDDSISAIKARLN